MKQGYDMGFGLVTIGDKVTYRPPGERTISGEVVDLTQDGDVCIKIDTIPNHIVNTKWRYVFPKKGI